MLPNSDDSRSDDRENLPLESAIALQCIYIKQCLQTLQELHQLVSTCSDFLVEDDSSHNLSIRHLYLLFDMYMSHSAMYCDEIQASVTRVQRTLEKFGG